MSGVIKRLAADSAGGDQKKAKQQFKVSALAMFDLIYVFLRPKSVALSALKTVRGGGSSSDVKKYLRLAAK